MVKHNDSVIAFVLGIVLGPIAEENLFRSLQISGGEYSIFISPSQPLSLVITILILIVLLGPFVGPWARRQVNRVT